jgi:hypothetical protein
VMPGYGFGYGGERRTSVAGLSLSTSGDPKRLLRGGGTASGVSDTARGCRRRHSRSSSACLMPAGIDEPSIRIVVGEQQRAEPWPRAFGIGPADHHEFLAEPG